MCLGKQPREGNAFRQQYVSVEWAGFVCKLVDLVGREQGCIKRRSTAQELSVAQVHHHLALFWIFSVVGEADRSCWPVGLAFPGIFIFQR